MTYQTIKTPAGETLVVLPLADYEALLDATNAQAHARAMAALANGTEEELTAEETAAFVDAPTPLAFWRRKRGLTQAALAARAGISQSYIAGLEAGDRKGDAGLIKRLAGILKLRMEDLVAD
jgi:ribosome-binding protein aMBF1 (putative translation factor)